MGHPERPARPHRLFAAIYDRMSKSAEASWLGECREALLAGLAGDVLEIGAGTGANLCHYPPGVRVVATEPDPAMRRRLVRKIEAVGGGVEICGAAAEMLPFPERSFDSVVGTLVFCSVSNQATVLAEVARVLRPGGRLVAIEHVRATGLRGRVQDWLSGPWAWLGAGCRPNRQTVGAIEEAGFVCRQYERFEPPRVPVAIRPFVTVQADRLPPPP